VSNKGSIQELYFLDSCICIYAINGKQEHKNVIESIKKYPSTSIKIPSIVAAELYYGLFKSDKNRYSDNIKVCDDFLSLFEIVDFGNDSALKYGEIRAYLEKEGIPIDSNDLIIAATVLTHNGILVTNNIKHFERLKELKLENWI